MSLFTANNHKTRCHETITVNVTVPISGGAGTVDFNVRGLGNFYIIRKVTIGYREATLKLYNDNEHLSKLAEFAS